MANSFKGNSAYIDTVSSDVDVALSMFGLSDAPVAIEEIRFYNATLNDIVIVKDKAGNIVAELKANVANQDLVETFGGETYRCQGLKLLAANQTVTTGNILIHFR